ncbi:MAG TPA: alpha/beta hydrolase-fold protein [Terriglobia bacterium]|nr:alpha/beta hydrolase-fold protein [Terriglobia bacterium]
MSSPATQPIGSGIHRQYIRRPSAALGRDMEMLVFGHAGARVLAFPTSMGRFFDWEDRGLVGALGERLEQGFIQLFCVDSVDSESWYNKSITPHDRAVRHTQYDQYLVTEVLPFTREINSNPFVIAAGPSFGAYHAANFAFRHPEHVNRLLGMSGYYDIKRFTEGYSDDAVYFNNPCDFLMHEHDAARLEALRRLDIILATGRTDSGCENNFYLSGILWSKNVWHALRLWDGFAHDWPYWQEMLKLYIGGHD